MNAAMELGLRERLSSFLTRLQDLTYGDERWEVKKWYVDELVQIFKQTAPETSVQTLTQCPKCGGPETDSDPACELCRGTGVCSAEVAVANVNRVAAEDYAKKLDELTAENETRHTPQSVRVAWKGLKPEEQLRCLLSLVEEWGYYGKFLEKTKGGDADAVHSAGTRNAATPADSTSAKPCCNLDCKGEWGAGCDHCHFHKCTCYRPLTRPVDEIVDSILGGKGGRVASAAERAAGKVSGPAQAALLALAVELRRGT